MSVCVMCAVCVILISQECCQPSLILVQSKTVTNKPLLDLICRRDEAEGGARGGDVYPFQVIKNNYWFVYK
jgi:hypothetical protein